MVVKNILKARELVDLLEKSGDFALEVGEDGQKFAIKINYLADVRPTDEMRQIIRQNKWWLILALWKRESERKLEVTNSIARNEPR